MLRHSCRLSCLAAILSACVFQMAYGQRDAERPEAPAQSAEAMPRLGPPEAPASELPPAEAPPAGAPAVPMPPAETLPAPAGVPGLGSRATAVAQLTATATNPQETILFRLRVMRLLQTTADAHAGPVVEVLSTIALNPGEAPVIRNRAIDVLEELAAGSPKVRDACRTTMLKLSSARGDDLNVRLHALNTAHAIALKTIQ